MKKLSPETTMRKSLRLIKKCLKDPEFNKYLLDAGYYVDMSAILEMWKQVPLAK